MEGKIEQRRKEMTFEFNHAINVFTNKFKIRRSKYLALLGFWGFGVLGFFCFV